jgi:hypothetical protein
VNKTSQIGRYCATFLVGLLIAALAAHLVTWAGLPGAPRLFCALSVVCLCAALPLVIDTIFPGKSRSKVFLGAATELTLGVALVMLLDYLVGLLWGGARLPIDLVFASIWTISLFTSLRDKLRRLQLQSDLHDTLDE